MKTSYIKKNNVNKKSNKINTRRILQNIGRWVVEILIIVVIAYAIVTFCVQTTNIVGPSMEPTLSNGDVVLINKLAYKNDTVKRYDIIVYKSRKNDHYYIKRVIGLPNETVQIINGYVYINGERLKDTPFNEKITTAGLALDLITLKENEYFVIGDNCNNSEDSRFANVGNITEDNIVGKIIYRVLPKDKFMKIE